MDFAQKPSLLKVAFSVLLAVSASTTSHKAYAQITSSKSPSDAPIHIQISKMAVQQTIPPTVFGSFLEPINSAVYGGLWADVLENGSFEEGLWSLPNLESMVRDRPELRRASELGLPTPWLPLHEADGNRYLPVRGDAANANQSILIMGLSHKEVGVRQRVYLSPRRELRYHGSLWIKHLRGDNVVHLTFSREGHPEDVMASTSITAADTAWTKYSFDLTLKPGQLSSLEPASFAVSVAGDTRALVDQITLEPSDNIEHMDPEMIHMLQQLHSPLLRFGGNFTSAYNWRDGIGPLDKRLPKLNFSWGIPEYNTFGTDEYLKLCSLIGAQPQIALNLGTGTSQDAAAWVQYVNAHFGDHTGALLWELGNELWGDYQIGYPPQGDVAATTHEASQAVRAVDPRARLIATGADEDHYESWNATQLSNPPGTFNLLSTHFVIRPETHLPHPAEDFVALASLALPVGLDQKLHAMYDQIQASPNRDKVKLAFTEWLIIGSSNAPIYSNMGGALFAGGFLNMILRDSSFVPVSDMTGNIEFGGLSKRRGQVFPAPAFWVLSTYAAAKPHTLLKVDSDGPTYSVAHGIDRLEEISNVPYLDITAALSEDRRHLLLFCVNRSLATVANASIDLAGIEVDSGSARVSTLRAESILSANSEEHPNLIMPVVSVSTVRPGRNLFSFPNASVTVLDIPVRDTNQPQ